MHELSVTTTIEAPPALVWRVLTDGPGHASWNPFIPELSGQLTVGQRLRVRICPPGGKAMTFRPVVTAVDPERELAWLGRAGLPGLFDGHHRFTLKARADGGTDLTQSEVFRGVLVPVMGTTLRRTEAGFTAMNEALRDRAETLAGRSTPEAGSR